MADQTHITSCGTHKDTPDKPTAVAMAFSALMTALPLHIEAEREIEDVNVFDPAFRSWLTDAEAVFTDVTNLFTAIATADVARAEDRPLKRMSMLLDAMVGSETPGTFQHYRELLPRFEHLFRCTGSGPVALQYDAMLVAAFAHIETMAMLLTYDGPGFADHCVPGVEFQPT